MSATPLGWIDWADRTPFQHAAHHAAVASMPVFAVPGAARDPVPQPLRLTDCWRHELVVAALGRPFTRWHQLTGSCVWAGGTNAAASVIFLDVIRRREPERIILPFGLHAYGESRRLAGMRGRGEGSLGSTFAKAVQTVGLLDSRTEGLPQPHEDDGYCYSEAVELQWSDGVAVPAAVKELGSHHPIRTAAPCTSAADAWSAVVNGYACSLAYGWYVGRARVQGTPPVLVGTFDSRGGHQVSLQGVWDHPEFGPLFLMQNNWPASVYPADPAGGAPCSCWLRERDVQAACLNGEVYAFSQYDGYPANPDVPALLDLRI